MIRVEAHREAELPELDAWLAADARAKVYLTSAWRVFTEAVVGGTPNVLVAREGERILGALPYFVERRPEGVVVNSQPWYGTHGGVWLSAGAPDAAREDLLRAYAEQTAALDPLGSTVVMDPDEGRFRDVYERCLVPTATDQRVGQVTALPVGDGDPGAAVLATVRQKTRNLVRKSLREGFEVACSGDDEDGWSFLAEVHSENLNAMGATPKPRSTFEALRSHLPAQTRRLYVARDAGEPVAALLLLDHNETVEYLTPVVRSGWRSRQPLSLLIYEAMCDSVRAGRTRWNWGGTWLSQRSLHHFKRGFGACDHPYEYLVRASDRLVAALRADRATLPAAFPGYYLYPFAALDPAPNEPST